MKVRLQSDGLVFRRVRTFAAVFLLVFGIELLAFLLVGLQFSHQKRLSSQVSVATTAKQPARASADHFSIERLQKWWDRQSASRQGLI